MRIPWSFRQLRTNGTPRRLFNAALLALAFGLAVGSAGPAQAGTIRIMALGDSLTAGFGLNEADGFTTRLEAALTQADGLHPNPEGVKIIVDRITPVVIDLIKAGGFAKAG